MATSHVNASPATLGGTGFHIESHDLGILVAQASGGHRLTAAGQIAVLAQVNTYLSGLGATTLASLIALTGAGVTLNSGTVVYPCQAADVAAQVTALTTILTTAANVTRG